MLKQKRTLTAMAVAALVLIGGAPAAANAAEPAVSAITTAATSTVDQGNAGILAVTKVSGSRSCGPDEQVYVRVELAGFGTAGIVASGANSQAKQGIDLIFTLGVRTTNWTLSAPVGIQNVNDGCTSR